MPLSDAQRMFLLIGNMHPHGIMPYRNLSTTLRQ